MQILPSGFESQKPRKLLAHFGIIGSCRLPVASGIILRSASARLASAAYSSATKKERTKYNKYDDGKGKGSESMTPRAENEKERR